MDVNTSETAITKISIDIFRKNGHAVNRIIEPKPVNNFKIARISIKPRIKKINTISLNINRNKNIVTESFKAKRNQHSAVESAVNCLEYHGLDKCRDHGKEGFEKYVGVAILSRNIDRIGDLLKKNTLACAQSIKKAA